MCAKRRCPGCEHLRFGDLGNDDICTILGFLHITPLTNLYSDNINGSLPPIPEKLRFEIPDCKLWDFPRRRCYERALSRRQISPHWGSSRTIGKDSAPLYVRAPGVFQIGWSGLNETAQYDCAPSLMLLTLDRFAICLFLSPPLS